jgi:hypothetical protein
MDGALLVVVVLLVVVGRKAKEEGKQAEGIG